MTTKPQQSSTELRTRVKTNPRPAVIWALGLALLVTVQLGAILSWLWTLLGRFTQYLPGVELTTDTGTISSLLDGIPVLVSRETIPNQGHWNGEQWVGTFSGLDPLLDPFLGLVGIEYVGLSPAFAWGLRVVLVYAYAIAFVAWVWIGYRWYRRHYRSAAWTPRDDVVDRLRTHYWGLFGLLVVGTFFVVVVFGPVLSPTTAEANIYDQYSHELTYWDEETASVETTSVGIANENSRSVGSENVGLFSYDDYDRFHPFGTLPNGSDLFTFIMYGARLSLIVGLLAIGLGTAFASVLAVFAAYYRGVLDLGSVLMSDIVMAMPRLLLLIMLTVVFSDTWLAEVYSGGLILALIFAATGWPSLWRAIRGPALQTAERGWINAARGFGQRPIVIMRKHMLPYLTGYLLVYGSMNLGGAIIAIAGLSYLGLGVSPPTPEWGRAIEAGQPYIRTSSWHVSLIPGVLITLLVVGFNALGDGLRDAIDPQSDAKASSEVGRGGGA